MQVSRSTSRVLRGGVLDMTAGVGLPENVPGLRQKKKGARHILSTVCLSVPPETQLITVFQRKDYQRSSMNFLTLM